MSFAMLTVIVPSQLLSPPRPQNSTLFRTHLLRPGLSVAGAVTAPVASPGQKVLVVLAVLWHRLILPLRTSREHHRLRPHRRLVLRAHTPPPRRLPRRLLSHLRLHPHRRLLRQVVQAICRHTWLACRLARVLTMELDLARVVSPTTIRNISPQFLTYYSTPSLVTMVPTRIPMPSVAGR